MQKINAMTVDVEDYFQVAALEPYIEKACWDTLPHRVENNTHRILDLFASKHIKATFFTLGWVAERYPQLIKRIVAENHELACHGYAHARVIELSAVQFRADISKAKAILEEIGGVRVNGYRAPTYSIGAKNLWALDVLQDEGFTYSSSIYPVKHDLYGMPEASRFMFEPIANHAFKEIPITTLKIGEKNWPCGGGGFFRFYPYALSKWAFQRVNDKDQQSGVFYFHPWEIDPEQPKQPGLSLKAQTRHYLNLNKMEARITRLLTDFKWDTMEQVFLK